jgi:hypothetical protein
MTDNGERPALGDGEMSGQPTRKLFSRDQRPVIPRAPNLGTRDGRTRQNPDCPQLTCGVLASAPALESSRQILVYA